MSEKSSPPPTHTGWATGLPAFDQAAAARARAHQAQLTKPPGSLGRLEDLAVFYAGARGEFPVAAPARPRLYVFAADHGVTPPQVTIPRDYNAAFDLIERNLRAGRADKIAFIDDAGTYTYADVDRRSSALRT